MTPERRQYLMRNTEADLTLAEIAEGYRFCCEWDGLLIHKSDLEAEFCTCLKEPHQP